MLVLTRKSEQKLIIGKNVVLTVLKIQGDQVSLGLEAPKSVSIYREEILREIEQANTVGAVESKSGANVQALAKNLSLAFKDRSGNKSKLSLFKNKEKK